jgi:acyl dehydratase
MGNRLYFDAVQVGDLLPPLIKRPSTQQLVMYAGASGDFYPLHYDQEFARAQGLPGIIVHGALKSAFLGQLVTDWIGVDGILVELSVRYREMDVPGDVLTCHGLIAEKRNEGRRNLVRCELWIENGQTIRTTTGEALVDLPLRPPSG